MCKCPHCEQLIAPKAPFMEVTGLRYHQKCAQVVIFHTCVGDMKTRLAAMNLELEYFIDLLEAL